MANMSAFQANDASSILAARTKKKHSPRVGVFCYNEIIMWLFLIAAIISEVIGTLSLRASNGFEKPAWIVVVIIGYGLAFYALSQSLKLGIPVGVAYAVWSAAGIVLTAIAAKIIWNDPLTLIMSIGIILIIGGVVLVEMGSTHS